MTHTGYMRFHNYKLSYISLDILRAVFIRSFVKLPVCSSGTDLGSSPICPPVASFNAWSRFNGFFLSTLIIIYIIYNMLNRRVRTALMDFSRKLRNKKEDQLEAALLELELAAADPPPDAAALELSAVAPPPPAAALELELAAAFSLCL
jgi:thiosulfate reductase cytochrome b subunit